MIKAQTTQILATDNRTSGAKGIVSRFLLLCTAAGLALSGCGGSGGTSGTAAAPAATTVVVAGVAATGAPIAGTVSLKDSSAIEKTTTTAVDGSYSFDVTGMTAPFIIKVSGTSGGTATTLGSFATSAGTANVNPLSNAAVANAAGGVDPVAVYANPSATTMQNIAANLPGAVSALRTRLKPLLDQYNADVDPITAPFAANHTGLDAVLDAVVVQLGAGNLTVANRTTNATIFNAPITNLNGGSFNVANLPASTPTQPGTQLDGTALYAANCQMCHGALPTSSKKGATASSTQAAINGNVGGMGFLSALTTAEVQAIADALAGNTTPTPAPTPAPAPAPTPTPVDGTALYGTKCASCHGPLATSNKKGTTAARTQTAINGNVGGMGFLSTLTSAEVQAIANALAVTAPAPTPAPAPAPAPTPAPAPAPTVDPGKTVYDSKCAGCHRVGTYDASGSAPNLSKAGTKVDGKYTAGVSGHKSITLTATEIANIKTFLNAN